MPTDNTILTKERSCWSNLELPSGNVGLMILHAKKKKQFLFSEDHHLILFSQNFLAVVAYRTSTLFFPVKRTTFSPKKLEAEKQ
jgi:hypothetical protein